MSSPLLIEAEKGCVIQGVNGTARYQIVLSLGFEYLGGNVVRIADREKYCVTGADELSATYTSTNWNSGIASGAFYAFRTLKIVRQEIIIREFAGRLPSSDMEAIANGVALAIAKLADREPLAIESEGWTIDCKVIALRPSVPAAQATVENQASAAGPVNQIA